MRTRFFVVTITTGTTVTTLTIVTTLTTVPTDSFGSNSCIDEER